jgi:hypothetical protein
VSTKSLEDIFTVRKADLPKPKSLEGLEEKRTTRQRDVELLEVGYRRVL